MEKILLNDEMNITIPEGFRVLTEAEIREMNYENNPPQFCMRNEEKHIVFAAAFKKTNMLFTAILSAKEVAGTR